MKDLIDKLSSYNIFNYFLPGILFVGLAEKVTSASLIQDNLMIGLFLYYFMGLIISRIGSLVLEPLLKRTKFIQFADYEDYVTASKSDPKIDLFSEQNNMYRTLCSLFIMLVLFKIFDSIKDTLPWSDDTSSFIFLLGILVMFLFAYRKQTRYIFKRVKATQREE